MMNIRIPRTRTVRGLLVLTAALLGGLSAGLVPASSSPTSYTVDEYPLPAGLSQPSAITAGPDNALWFTLEGASAIGRIPTNATPGSGAQVTSYSFTPESAANKADAITTGAEGYIWFTENSGPGEIGRVLPSSGKVEQYKREGDWRGITVGPGPEHDLWATNNAAVIEQIAPGSSPTFTAHSTNPPELSDPDGIANGPDGNLWFTSDTTGGGTWKMTTGGAATKVIASEHPGGNGAEGIVTGPDKNLWLTEQQPTGAGTANAIARVTPSGEAKEFAIPTAESHPSQIVAGSDGALWFTEKHAGKIGRITTAGAIEEIALPAGSEPTGITNGPDGNIWFTERGANKIGEIVLAKQVTTTPTTTTTTTTTPAPPPKATLAGRPVVSGEEVTVPVACNGIAGQTCTGSALVSTTEHMNAKGSLVAVSSKKHAKPKRPRTKVVTVGSKSFTAAAGKTVTVKLTLNATGKRLLKRFKVLPALLKITTTASGLTTIVASRKVVFRQARVKGCTHRGKHLKGCTHRGRHG